MVIHIWKGEFGRLFRRQRDGIDIGESVLIIMDIETSQPRPFATTFNVQAQEHRELSVNNSMVTSTYSYHNSYEQLLQHFKHLTSSHIDLSALHHSKLLKLKKYKEAVYYGEQQQGKRQGCGIMLYNSGQHYEGDWHEDNRHGHGYEKYANGCVYEGNYEHGKMQGLGKYVWTNGQVYEGEWANNMKHGSGMWRSERGDSYIGEWKEGVAEGFGVFTEVEGSRYEGEFHMFMKHGQGTEKFSSGDIYKGEYLEGKFDGFGEYYWKNGSYYKGHFSKGMRSGHGLWKKGQGTSDKYEGEFLNNKKHGYGIYTWSVGHVYKGNYVDNMRHGYGEMYWQDGSFYKGQWELDRQNGEGELFNGDDGLTRGIFKDGVLLQPAELPPPSAKKINEFYTGSSNENSLQYDFPQRFPEARFLETPASRQRRSPPSSQLRNREMAVTSHFTIDQARPVRIASKPKSINPLVRDSFLRKKLMQTINMRPDHKNNVSGEGHHVKRERRGSTREKVPHSALQMHRMHRYRLGNDSLYDPAEKTSDASLKFAFKRGRRESEDHQRYFSRMA